MCEVFVFVVFVVVVLYTFRFSFNFSTLYPKYFIVIFSVNSLDEPLKLLEKSKKKEVFFFHFTKRRKDRGEVKEERAEIRTCLLFLLTDK